MNKQEEQNFNTSIIAVTPFSKSCVLSRKEVIVVVVMVVIIGRRHNCYNGGNKHEY